MGIAEEGLAGFASIVLTFGLTLVFTDIVDGWFKASGLYSLDLRFLWKLGFVFSVCSEYFVFALRIRCGMNFLGFGRRKTLHFVASIHIATVFDATTMAISLVL